MLRDLLVDGIISGMGGVLVFLPNILILYFFIALMEDTGYMSRAVFLMDRLMHKIGLHGKSFIPLVMGFGCNVPAILATRILENRNERMLTIMMNPFISCNARLPVYILFISAFFPENSGTILFAIYVLGVLLAIATALILKRAFFRKAPQPFVMELPPYRMPTRSALLQQMWMRSAQYLKKIGGVILIASVIFWALSYFPHEPKLSKDYQRLKEEKVLQLKARMDARLPNDTLAWRVVYAEGKKTIRTLELQQRSELKERSILGRIGHFIEPAIRPLGFDWRFGISILSGIPAKEIIISSLSILYQVEEDKEGASVGLVEKLKAQKDDPGTTELEKGISPLTALSFMVFVLLYLPCIGTLTAIIRESGSWKWGAFMVAYTLAVAWLMSFIVYQGGTLLGF
jgi:ferrous iron transport protein B